MIAPWRDPAFRKQFTGRPDLLAFAKEHGIPVTSTVDKPYSMDGNLMHMSYEAGSLEDPMVPPREEMFQMTVSPEQAPDAAQEIQIHFEAGVPIKIDCLEKGESVTGALALFCYLNALAGKHGIGRVDIVENRFIGMKSRGVYETPAGTVLHQAHLDLETLVLDREVFCLKESLSPKIARLIYNGLWFSPEMKFLMHAINKSQEELRGTVVMKLYKGTATVVGRQSPASGYDAKLASMDTLGAYDQSHAEGFIRTHALRLARAAVSCEG